MGLRPFDVPFPYMLRKRCIFQFLATSHMQELGMDFTMQTEIPELHGSIVRSAKRSESKDIFACT